MWPLEFLQSNQLTSLKASSLVNIWLSVSSCPWNTLTFALLITICLGVGLFWFIFLGTFPFIHVAVISSKTFLTPFSLFFFSFKNSYYAYIGMFSIILRVPYILFFSLSTLTVLHSLGEFDPGLGKILWTRTWQPTPVFWHGESHGQKSKAGYSA